MSTFGIDVTAIKAFLGYDPTDTSRDAILLALLDASLKNLKDLTGRNLVYGAYRDTFSNFAQKTYLREWPVTLLHMVSTNLTEIATTEYRFFGASGLLHFHWHRPSSRYFTDNGAYCYVDYVGGYTVLPGDMYMAVMSAIQAADNAQRQSLTYGGAIKRLTVYDVGVTDFGATSTSVSIIRDILTGQLSSMMSEYAMGTPNLHETEYLGPASLFTPSEV